MYGVVYSNLGMSSLAWLALFPVSITILLLINNPVIPSLHVAKSYSLAGKVNEALALYEKTEDRAAAALNELQKAGLVVKIYI